MLEEFFFFLFGFGFCFVVVVVDVFFFANIKLRSGSVLVDMRKKIKVIIICKIDRTLRDKRKSLVAVADVSPTVRSSGYTPARANHAISRA